MEDELIRLVDRSQKLKKTLESHCLGGYADFHSEVTGVKIRVSKDTLQKEYDDVILAIKNLSNQITVSKSIDLKGHLFRISSSMRDSDYNIDYTLYSEKERTDEEVKQLISKIITEIRLTPIKLSNLPDLVRSALIDTHGFILYEDIIEITHGDSDAW